VKILVTACQVPFIQGGSNYHINGTVNALRQAGHDVELTLFPFKFQPESDIQFQMKYLQELDFNGFNGHKIDRVISLQFPGYGINHDEHVVWVMHQHRAVYELYDEEKAESGLKALKPDVEVFDNRAFDTAKLLYANSNRVADRIKRFNNFDAQPLYHPPFGEEKFFNEEDYGYIFYPSRLETLKRQDLLIEAARYLKTPALILIGGDGAKKDYYQSLIEKYDLADRVRLIGRFSEAEKYQLYARALGIFFGPFDEDYGYITLESMLSSKPVITCTDSGGPLEFVRDNSNGFICEPSPEQIAEKIDWLYSNRQAAKQMGQQGLKDYQQQNISWQNVLEKLLA
jgi:glycosyltransferase involved in cell wall biosynthesis